MHPANHRRRRKKVDHYRTAVDAKLMERTGFDELALHRLRRALMTRWQTMDFRSRGQLLEGGTYPRFNFLTLMLREHLDPEYWRRWLAYLEHSEQDIAEMGRGEYPISPYLIRVFSALFGIKIDFLLVGDAPTVEPRGVSIDLWPLTGTSR